MHPMMMGEDEGGEMDDEALEKQLLQEILDWSGKGTAGDMRARLGKPMPEDEGGMEEAAEAPAEDATIPGVEATPEAEGEGGGPDVEKLKLVLARMKR